MALGRDIDRLRRVPVFACLDAEALKLIAFSGEARRLPAGHVLFRRGEPADAATLLISGRLALDAEHEDALSVRWALGGALLNEFALFAPGVQDATATAHEDCVVMSVSGRLMRRVLDAHPANAAPLRRHLAARIRSRLAGLRAAAPP